MKVLEEQMAKNAGRKLSPCVNPNILDGSDAELDTESCHTYERSDIVTYKTKLVFKCWSRNRAKSFEAFAESHMVMWTKMMHCL